MAGATHPVSATEGEEEADEGDDGEQPVGDFLTKTTGQRMEKNGEFNGGGEAHEEEQRVEEDRA